MDSLHFAKYPFLRDSSDYVKDSGVTLDDLLASEICRPARVRGKQRVIDTLDLGEVQIRPMRTEEERLEETLSYPMARILVSCINDKFLIRRYALAEGVAMYERLQTDELDIVEEVAYQLDVKALRDEDDLRMHFSDFLRFTSRMREKEWKLVNTEVRQGFVTLSKKHFARVLQQALQDKLESELPIQVTNDISKILAEDLKELKARTELRRNQYKANDFGKVHIENFPPCMKHLIAMAQVGENMPHSGRFSLTAFLHHIGLSAEEILALFSKSPDFDVGKTKYQVDHITGETSGTEYTPPECATMKSYGICYEPDSLCDNPRVKHPLTYYRIKNMTKDAAITDQKG